MTLSGTLAGKTALITGASSGIGQSIAQRFLAEGMNVVLFGRNKQNLQQVAQEHDGRACIVVGDVTAAADRQRLVQSAVDQFGHIDVFVPAAGVLTFAGVEQVTEQVLLHHLNTNFISIVELTNLVVPHIPRGGSVVFISTSITSGGFPGLAAYSASKGALEAYMRTAAVELAAKDIIVNAVAPGPTKTPIWTQALPPEILQQVAATIGPRLLTREFGDPEAVADAVMALAFNPSIRGQRIVTDAGYGIN
ncbi:oxidoreductase [Ktedonobacteria bacterium brp13]|nr:oxidoreductase [Ktedonobacteria bacterium brp13]